MKRFMIFIGMLVALNFGAINILLQAFMTVFAKHRVTSSMAASFIRMGSMMMFLHVQVATALAACFNKPDVHAVV